MKNHLLALIALLGLVALGTAACDDHYTTQEATATCTELSDRNPGANPPSAFDECVACFERCGVDCEQTGDTDKLYVCPDEVGSGGAGGGG
jgi:hypothetical protein